MLRIAGIAWLFMLLLAACVPKASGSREASPTPVLVPFARWVPTVGQSWQYDFSAEPDLSINADIFILDMFETDPALIEQLHSSGKHVLCYISVGSWEDWRPDKNRFPNEVVGKDYAGWTGEKWLDIRRLDLIGPIMQDRLEMCKQKRFDGVEPDNIDIHDNDSGFNISAQDQYKYALWLSEQAHKRGLTIGLKNAPDQSSSLLPYYDFAVIEDCFVFGWCEAFIPYIQAGKPVFAIEYTDSGVSIENACQNARSMGFSLILKNRGLDSYRRICQ